jgi:heme/copper-type cytochrome/quinol oxidase subunit 1
MIKGRRNRGLAYLLCVSVIAVVWIPLSSVLCLTLAGLEDNPDVQTSFVWPVKLAWAVVSFPMSYLGDWGRPQQPADFEHSAFLHMLYLQMLVNGILWGFALVFLSRLVAKLLSARKHEPHKE